MITIPITKEVMCLIIGAFPKVLDLTDNKVKTLHMSFIFPIYPCKIVNKYEPSDQIYLN